MDHKLPRMPLSVMAGLSVEVPIAVLQMLSVYGVKNGHLPQLLCCCVRIVLLGLPERTKDKRKTVLAMQPALWMPQPMPQPSLHKKRKLHLQPTVVRCRRVSLPLFCPLMDHTLCVFRWRSLSLKVERSTQIHCTFWYAPAHRVNTCGSWLCI